LEFALQIPKLKISMEADFKYAYHGISRRPFYLSNMFPYAVFAFWKMNRSIIVLAPLIWLKLYSEGSLHKLGFYCSS